MTFADPFLLETLRCPASHSKLIPLTESELAKLNGLIAEKSLQRRGGPVVHEALSAGLKNSEATHAYPIRSKIIQLIVEDSIVLPPSFQQEAHG